MNGRIYDPLIGRFMSADPTIPNPNNLQSFNRYTYVRNNPLKLWDPTGYKDDENPGGGGGSTGTLEYPSVSEEDNPTLCTSPCTVSNTKTDGTRDIITTGCGNNCTHNYTYPYPVTDNSVTIPVRIVTLSPSCESGCSGPGTRGTSGGNPVSAPNPVTATVSVVNIATGSLRGRKPQLEGVSAAAPFKLPAMPNISVKKSVDQFFRKMAYDFTQNHGGQGYLIVSDRLAEYMAGYGAGYDSNSDEGKAAGLAVLGVTLFGLPGGVAKEAKALSYDARVRQRALQDPTSHNFPYSFDKNILNATPIPQKNGYNIYRQPGSMAGSVTTDSVTGIRTQTIKNGNFEIGVRSDGVIDHRFFRPD